ncbi:hypothetical protein LMH87_001089 [Akanthomyces muscarius]|uniref:Uncharacterized protein n=1 Tax=Akanthomyces muscarius TaxID=2231603 RepID=A0A9W8QFU2_AKAMU|nr:hypothetical protein LMH87_001089 [Akanthomyces muscarius]KAJ4155864.1 hypothetical protein LMH87_001089 [Akanthomyces muscarius]
MLLNFRKLLNKHVLVIGGTSGIGRGVAEGILSAGGRVSIASLSQAKINATLQELRNLFPEAHISGYRVDLASDGTEKRLSELLSAVAKDHGRLQHVVFTAGDALSGPTAPEAFTPELLARLTHLRAIVPFTLVKVIVAEGHLDRDRSSSILLTSGNVAVRPVPGWSVGNFVASGLEGAVRGLALDLAPLRVNVVAPGSVDTGLWGDDAARQQVISRMDARLPTGSIGHIEDVAEAYLWLLRDRNVTGMVARTEGGLNLV